MSAFKRISLFLVLLFASVLLCLAVATTVAVSHAAPIAGAPAKAQTDDIAIDETNFPNTTFRQYVSEKADVDLDGYLSENEIAAVTDIYVSTMGISDLKGIEYFTALKNLYCQGNGLWSIDLSRNTALERVTCSANNFTSLDLSALKSLQYLDCSQNKLTSITIDSEALDQLHCERNSLHGLDLSQFVNLTYLNCEYNDLTELDLTNNAALKYLYCGNNDLTELDLTENVVINTVDCSDNALTELDLKGFESLKNLSCSNNAIKSLDLTGCVELYGLDCTYNNMEELILTGLADLNSINCQNNKITVLDLSDCTSLKSLYCAKNKLLTLDVSMCNISRLDCDSQQAEYAASKNGEIWELDLSEPLRAWEKVSNVSVTDGTLGDDGKTVTFEGESAVVEYAYATGFGLRNMYVTLTLTHGFRITVDGGIIENSSGSYMTVAEKGTVTVSADAPEGKVFEGWSLDGGETVISSEPVYTFTAVSDVTITAVYSEIPAPPESDPDEEPSEDETPSDSDETPTNPDETPSDINGEIVPFPSEPKGLSDGAIAGIVIGSFFGAIVIAYAVCAILFKKGIIKGAFFSKIYPFIK